MENYYGDPNGLEGASSECKECNCSGNTDKLTIGNCHRTSGICLKVCLKKLSIVGDSRKPILSLTLKLMTG
jgi:hypothetical protein